MESRGGNRFLGALPLEVRRRCLALGKNVVLKPGAVVGHKGDMYEDVHFPVTGMISEVEEGGDGGSAEITIVGFEGCSGIEALLGVDVQPFMRCTEVETEALAIPAHGLRALCGDSPDLRRLTGLYAAAKLRGLGISIGCYARHQVPERLARWLLRVRDRMSGVTFELTQDTIARMLGVRRSTVTRALAELAAAGAITSTRNRITIVRNDVLEQHACSCYPDGRAVFIELYGDSVINEVS